MDLFKRYQIGIQDFRVIDSSLDESKLSDFKADGYVVKAQVLTGGRGRGHYDNGFKGGVHVTKDRNELSKLIKNMIGHNLITKQTTKEGLPVDKVMVMSRAIVKRETYFAIILEPTYNGVAVVVSPAGGMEIEDVAVKTPHLVKSAPIDIFQGITDEIANELAEFLQFKDEMKKKCADEIKKYWRLFLEV